MVHSFSYYFTKSTFVISALIEQNYWTSYTVTLGAFVGSFAALLGGSFSVDDHTTRVAVAAGAFAHTLVWGGLQFALKSYSVDEQVFNLIAELVPKGGTLLEFGSGPGTKTLTNSYTVHSVEHDPRWVNYIKESNYIHAPIVEYADPSKHNGEVGWYDINVILKKMPAKYDLILVDGPPGFIGRHGFVENLDKFNTNVPILIDDINRQPELDMLHEICAKLGRKPVIKQYRGKAFGYVPAPDSAKAK